MASSTSTATSTPSALGYEQTVTSVGVSAELIATEARSIGETMDALSEAFNLITGDDERQSLGALGLAGVPLMATWRAIRSAAEQIVGQRTGRPLSEWLDFVSAASEQFEDYGRTLDSLDTWTRAGRTDEPRPPTEDDITMLAGVRHETKAWKVVLRQVARVGSLVDAVLDSRATVDGDASAPTAGKGWRSLKEFVPPSVIETVTSVGTSDIRDWLFRPLLDLRSQVERLPGSVSDVAEEVSILEVKLDLAIAQAESTLGRLSGADVEIIELRVAGTVLVPALMGRLAEARDEVDTRRNHLTRLSEMEGRGTIDATVGARLRLQYAEALAAADDQLAGIDDEVTRWRAEGPPLVDRALAWIDSELDCLQVRSVIEEDGDLADRVAVLEAEKGRLADVESFLRADESALTVSS